MARSRASLVREAHQRGLTLSGLEYARSGGSLSLAERTPNALRRQAHREIADAYGDTLKGINQRDSQIRALDQKRQSDERAFNDWLATQQAAILSQADTNANALRTASGTAQNELADRLKGILAQPTPAGLPQSPVVTATAQAATERGNVAQQTELGRIGAGQTLLSGVASNNLAYTAALAAKGARDTYDALIANASDRDKVLLTQARDLAHRTAELLTGEQTKAQARIAATQFGIKQANDNANKAAGRTTTERGQTLSHTDRVAARAEKDAQKRQDFIAKYGVPPEQYNKWTSQHRKRWLKGLGKGAAGGTTDTGPSAKQRATANTNVIHWVGVASGQTPQVPKGAKKGAKAPTPPPNVGPGHTQVLSVWLQKTYGIPKAVADVAAAHVVYGSNFKWTKKLHGQYLQYAAGLPN